MTITHAEREEIHQFHTHAGEQFRRTGKYPPLPREIKDLQKKAGEPEETVTPPHPTPAPITATAPVHTNGTETAVRRQEDLDRRITEIKEARKKEADDNQAEINRILSPEMPGMASARARQRTGKHSVLEASDLTDNGLVMPGRRSFRISAETGRRQG